ncbi:LytR C-terminal domain-containing protein [Nocardioides stalactiti]|uniref:LytR C-terminal domain-containing protein n=1 Tax=Nocardioides stalactiti TaxID=2755356 RepID=UPI0016013084|nr:LytR C-terminal domain-containing protein [Nocardioides stalactiti]
MDTKARATSAGTLAVLAVVFIIGVAWAWSSVTEPFPEKEEQAACLDTTVAAGEKVSPPQVHVNVLNASSTEGLAGETMDALVRKGFGEGSRGNTAAATGSSGAVIWTTDPTGPAAELLQTYLGDDTEIVQQATSEPGITVVVGEGFPGLQKGRKNIKADSDGTVCSPPELVAPTP